MTAFFILTQRVVVGPFNGIELREAALAGIIRHDGIVGGAAQGPWYQACDIGLFDEKKAALPHPPGTPVHLYQVRGMPGAFQGPFKLRELIGFAARGMLPPDAQIQSDVSDQWIPAARFRILAACMFGDLVLIDHKGNLLLRNISMRELDLEENVLARAPIDVVRSVDTKDATTVASVTSEEDWDPAEAEAPQPMIVTAEFQPPQARQRRRRRSRMSVLSSRVTRVQQAIPRRLALQCACTLIVFVGVASAFSYWKQIGLKHQQIVGEWVGMTTLGEDRAARFGIAFRTDETCVIFNAQGESWSGDYSWEQRIDDSVGFGSNEAFSTVFDYVESRHQSGVVKPTDGYIRFRGFRDPPMIDGHHVRDLFLRRRGDRLHLGYLTSVDWLPNSTTMKAGWIVADPSRKVRPSVMAALRALEVSLPVPVDEFGGERPPHISDAIRRAQQGVTVTGPDGESVKVHESLAYSLVVDGAYLLEQFGLPDEARAIHPFEKPDLRNGPSFEQTQVVRYGKLKLFLSPEGKMRYVAIASEYDR